MQTYILMTKLSPTQTVNMKNREEIGRMWLQEVKDYCPEVHFIAHYALLGTYDFMDIYEAPDPETAAKVSMISKKNGALTSDSWSAIPYSRFLEMIEEF